MAETVGITQLEWEHYNRKFFVIQCYTKLFKMWTHCINCTITTNTLIPYTHIIIIKYYYDNNKLSINDIINQLQKPLQTIGITQSQP